MNREIIGLFFLIVFAIIGFIKFINAIDKAEARRKQDCDDYSDMYR